MILSVFIDNFKGNTEQNQLEIIARLCGPITRETMPNCEKLPLYRNIGLQLTKYHRAVNPKLENIVKVSDNIIMIFNK